MKKYYLVCGFVFEYLDDAIRDARKLDKAIIHYFNGEDFEKIYLEAQNL